MILRFNIDTKFSEFFPTPYNGKRETGDSFFSLLDGLICIGASNNLTYSSCLEIWVLKEYGLMSSWIRVSVIDDYGELLELI